MLQDELEEQSSQGSFTPSGRMDILATAIGKAEYPGRVRGEPRGVGISKYFGKASLYSSQAEPSQEFVDKLRDQIREELRDELMTQLRGEMKSWFDFHHMEATRVRNEESPAFPSTKGSHNPPDESLVQPSHTPQLVAEAFHNPEPLVQPSHTPELVAAPFHSLVQPSHSTEPCGQPSHITEPLGQPSATPESGESCILYLDTTDMIRVVADALVYTKATTHHHNQIPQYLRRVTVTRVHEGEEGAAIPIPDVEIATLGQAIGGFILWPQYLIGTLGTPPMVGIIFISLDIYWHHCNIIGFVFYGYRRSNMR